MSTNPINIKEHFKDLHQDGITWKAKRLWENAKDPDEQALAMDQLVETICCISNETKRQGYIDLVQSENRIKSNLLKKRTREVISQREAKKQAEIAKKKLEAQFRNTEDAGLPSDFKGNIYDALKYGIYEHEGVYYSRGVKGADYPVTNFTMKILYHVNTGDEQAFRLIAVKNVYGFESFINLNTDDFVSLGSFKKVLARRGDYIFKGVESDLSRLQEFLQKDEVSTVYIKTLGWHKRGKFYAFANGIIPLEKNENGKIELIPVDEYGIIGHQNKNYFIPAVSKMYADKDDMFVNEKKFVYNVPVKGYDFAKWADLFYKTYGVKSITGILWYTGTLFRDIIMKQIQRFPLLNLFGPPGAGKGQYAESLMSLFGEKQDQIMLGGASTVVGFMRKFAQFSNAIVWLDEYKNNLPFKFIESFKNIYDGKGYERGKMTNDFATESTPIHSSCILSGQDMPTIEPALFMRVIMLSFEEGKFTDEQRASFQELKELEGYGLSFITAELLQYRAHFEAEFKEQYNILFKQLRKEINPDVDDRMIVNVSMLLTFHRIFLEKLRFPFNYNEAKAFLLENMENQYSILAGNNDVAKFWDVIQTLFGTDLIAEGKDFVLEDGYIYLRLMQVYPLYMKELRQRGDMNVLAKPTLEHYLKLDKSVYNDYVRKRFPDTSNNWCFKMKYAKLNQLYKLDLIKVKRDGVMSLEMQQRQLNQKYHNMGIETEEMDREEDVPFPVIRN